MIKSISCSDGNTYDLDLPSICPHCNQSGTPDMLICVRSKTIYFNTIMDTINLVLQCTSCNRNFFVEYFLTSERIRKWVKILVLPNPKPKLDIPENIKEYYPDFYEIYTQSSIAESNNLTHIAGMGFRKSIEFLVKNYLIDLNPSEKETILKETLGKSIERIKYKNIQILAKAATWLGNDQTHIIQKHEDYGIQDIKAFTLALCHLILSEKAAEKAFSLVHG